MQSDDRGTKSEDSGQKTKHKVVCGGELIDHSSYLALDSEKITMSILLIALERTLQLNLSYLRIFAIPTMIRCPKGDLTFALGRR